MTSDRPYRKGTSFANAIAEISRCAGSQFDPEVVRAFLDIGEAGLVKIRTTCASRRRKAARRTAPGAAPARPAARRGVRRRTARPSGTGRAATPCGARCATCGSRSPIAATCAARTACRRRSTRGCRRPQILSFEELSALVDRFVALGVDKVRLTGGEPLVRRDLPALVTLLAAKPALSDLALTTNGVLLAEQARALQAGGAAAPHGQPGHAASPSVFRALTRRDAHARGAGGHRGRRAAPASPAASSSTRW